MSNFFWGQNCILQVQRKILMNCFQFWKKILCLSFSDNQRILSAFWQIFTAALSKTAFYVSKDFRPNVKLFSTVLVKKNSTFIDECIEEKKNGELVIFHQKSNLSKKLSGFRSKFFRWLFQNCILYLQKKILRLNSFFPETCDFSCHCRTLKEKILVFDKIFQSGMSKVHSNWP